MDYFDILLAKKLKGEGGGGDITIKSLNVTQNGTYSEEGVAYSPVEVNVPLPENAYLLKDVPDTPTAIATFSDGANLPMPKLEVGIEPVQSGSGDPSPENIRPISGWDEVNVSVSGVNIWDEEWESGGYSATTGNKTSSTSSIRAKNKIAIVPNTSYYCNFTTGAMNVICFYDKNGTFIVDSAIGISTKGVITTPNNAYFMTFQMSAAYGATYNNDISINYPSTDTDYHAYNGHTYTIDLNGTRYGGKVDLVSGVMTVDRAYLTIDDFSSFGGSGTSAGGLHWFDVRNKPEGKSGNKNICSICGYIQNGWTSTITVMSVAISETIPVRIYDSSESLSDFKDKYPNLQLVYELATPFTIQLSPTPVISLDGVNNLWADSGDIIELEYFGKEV